ncbi:hypothetical protein ABVT39_003281 [Epinephelus coioides]
MTQKHSSEPTVGKMAGLCGLSLRVSWISCLLINSISCLPAPKGYGSNNPGPAPGVFMGWRPSSGSSYPNVESSGSTSGIKLGSVGGGDGMDSSFSAPQATGSFSSGYASSVGSGYDNSGYNNVGIGLVGGLYYPSSGSTDGEGDVEESSEPVLSDVSDLEPVYSFRSRSSYQHGRAAFSQTRYTPGEVLFPTLPAVQNSPQQPVKASSKGSY